MKASQCQACRCHETDSRDGRREGLAQSENTEGNIVYYCAISTLSTLLYYYIIPRSICINPFSAASPNRKCGLAGKKSRFQFFSFLSTAAFFLFSSTHSFSLSLYLYPFSPSSASTFLFLVFSFFHPLFSLQSFLPRYFPPARLHLPVSASPIAPKRLLDIASDPPIWSSSLSS